MAAISRALFLRHLRAGTTSHVRHWRNGRLVHSGDGASFWFHPLTAVLSEIPVGDREVSLTITARTGDFQDVTVQAALAFRIVEPGLAAARIDFAIDPETGAWIGDPMRQMEGMLAELAQTQALEVLAGMPLAEALSTSSAFVRARMETGLRSDPRVVETGVEVAAVRITGMRAEPDMERALQVPARELVQQEADRATFERRALAVERERAIGNNELTTRIELARQEEQLVVQRGRNERRRAEEEAAAGRILAETEAALERLRAQANADATRLVGEAEAEAESARLAAYRGVEPATLLGLAARELAGHLPAIGALTVTPDMLTGLLVRLGTGAGGPAMPHDVSVGALR